MIRVRDASILKRMPKDAGVVIDLKGASSQRDLLVQIVMKLPSKFSHTVDGMSLDYFIETVSDWMRETLPDSAHVIVFCLAAEMDGFVVAKVVAALHQAMLMALSQRFQDDKDFDILKGLRALRIDFYF